MQLTIFMSDDDVRALRNLAGKECRSLHQEAKWLLRQAIKEAAPEPQCVLETEVLIVTLQDRLAECREPLEESIS